VAPLGSRLYAILDVDRATLAGQAPLTLADRWLEAGVRLFQLRAKQLASGPMLELAEALQTRARAAGAIFVVNDRADVARLSAAAGVHVGQDDLRPADARRVVGPDAIVGVSTHTDEQVRRALLEPASYLAIGPVFATTSKANPDPVVGLDGVARAAALARPSGRPLVAIGGIDVIHAPRVIEAGADAVAIIGDLLVGDPAARVREYLEACGR
jgi:thiamine-phosphate pyrophosphorylase